MQNNYSIIFVRFAIRRGLNAVGLQIAVVGGLIELDVFADAQLIERFDIRVPAVVRHAFDDKGGDGFLGVLVDFSKEQIALRAFVHRQGDQLLQDVTGILLDNARRFIGLAVGGLLDAVRRHVHLCEVISAAAIVHGGLAGHGAGAVAHG